MPGDFLELEVIFETGSLRSKSFMALRVKSVEELQETGAELLSTFIGSDDQEINGAFESGSNANVSECVIEAVAVVHAQRWKRHSVDSLRALAYLSTQVLKDYFRLPWERRL